MQAFTNFVLNVGIFFRMMHDYLVKHRNCEVSHFCPLSVLIIIASMILFRFTQLLNQTAAVYRTNKLNYMAISHLL